MEVNDFLGKYLALRFCDKKGGNMLQVRFFQVLPKKK